MTGQRENLAASFLLFIRISPSSRAGKFRCSARKVHASHYCVLNTKSGETSGYRNPCQHAGATSISQETSQPLPVHLQHLP